MYQQALSFRMRIGVLKLHRVAQNIMDEENPPTMKEIIQRNVTIKDDIKDFHRNLKGVSKEIMRKSKAVRR
jgi:hypothetical protein